MDQISRNEDVVVQRMGLGSGRNQEGKWRVACGSGSVVMSREQFVEMIRNTPQDILEEAGYYPPSGVK